jgi:hypothetical protein
MNASMTHPLDSLLKPLISLDEDGLIVHATPIAAMLLRTSAAQLTGRPVSSLFAGIEARTQCVNRRVCATLGDGSTAPVTLSIMDVATGPTRRRLAFFQPLASLNVNPRSPEKGPRDPQGKDAEGPAPPRRPASDGRTGV